MWVLKKYYTTSCIILLMLITLIVLSYFNFSQNKETKAFRDFKNLHNGDLILRCGRSTESFALYMADANSEFTHIGIISIENEIPYVIHAVPCKTNLIQKETLSTFLHPKNASEFAIYRSDFNKIHLDKVVKKANNYYLNKYEFDTKYDLSTDSKLYCTELVLKAFNSAGATLKVKPKELNFIIGKHIIIFPSAFTKAPFFTRII